MPHSTTQPRNGASLREAVLSRICVIIPRRYIAHGIRHDKKILTAYTKLGFAVRIGIPGFLHKFQRSFGSYCTHPTGNFAETQNLSNEERVTYTQANDTKRAGVEWLRKRQILRSFQTADVKTTV